MHSWQNSTPKTLMELYVFQIIQKDLFKFIPTINKKVITIYNGVDEVFFRIRNIKKN